MEKVGRLSYDVFLVIMRSLPQVRRQGAICLMRVSCGHWRLAVKVQRFGIECMKAWGDSEGYDQVDGFDPKRLVILVVRNEQ